MEERKLDFPTGSGENLYNEKNDAIIAPDSYYSEKEADFSEEERYYEIIDNSKPKTRAFSVVSLSLGIISILLCFVGWLGFILGAAAIALSIVSRVKLGYFDSMAVAGLILGIFGVVFGVFYIIFTMIFGPDLLGGTLLGAASGNIESPSAGI